MKYVLAAPSMLFVIAACSVLAAMTFPTTDISSSPKTNDGYEIKSVVDSARVVFPASGWKLIERTFPGGNYLIEPMTGASLRFYAIDFGRQYKEFLIWGYTTSEHQWARKFDQVANEDQKQAEFLREWIERSLRRAEAQPPDNLTIAYPILQPNKATAVLYPLSLDPPDQRIETNQQVIGGHRFTHAQVRTVVSSSTERVSLQTSLYISHFRYVPRFNEWQFFAAFAHVPDNLSAKQREAVLEIFLKTLSTLSLDPVN